MAPKRSRRIAANPAVQHKSPKKVRNSRRAPAERSTDSSASSSSGSDDDAALSEEEETAPVLGPVQMLIFPMKAKKAGTTLPANAFKGGSLKNIDSATPLVGKMSTDHCDNANEAADGDDSDDENARHARLCSLVKERAVFTVNVNMQAGEGPALHEDVCSVFVRMCTTNKSKSNVALNVEQPLSASESVCEAIYKTKQLDVIVFVPCPAVDETTAVGAAAAAAATPVIIVEITKQPLVVEDHLVRAPTKKTNPATARKIEATDTALAVVKNVATVFVDAFDQSERAGFAARSLLYVSLGGNNKTYEPFNDAMLETIRAAVPPKGKRTVLVKAGFAALSKVEEDPRSLVGLRKRRGDGFDFAALVNGTAAVDQAQVRTVAQLEKMERVAGITSITTKLKRLHGLPAFDIVFAEEALKIAASLIYDCGDTQLADQGWGNVKRVLAMELSNADFTEDHLAMVMGDPDKDCPLANPCLFNGLMIAKRATPNEWWCKTTTARAVEAARPEATATAAAIDKSTGAVTAVASQLGNVATAMFAMNPAAAYDVKLARLAADAALPVGAPGKMPAERNAELRTALENSFFRV